MQLDDASLLDFDVDVDLSELLQIPKVGASTQENAGPVRPEFRNSQQQQPRETYFSLEDPVVTPGLPGSRTGTIFLEERSLNAGATSSAGASSSSFDGTRLSVVRSGSTRVLDTTGYHGNTSRPGTTRSDVRTHLVLDHPSTTARNGSSLDIRRELDDPSTSSAMFNVSRNPTRSMNMEVDSPSAGPSGRTRVQEMELDMEPSSDPRTVRAGPMDIRRQELELDLSGFRRPASVQRKSSRPLCSSQDEKHGHVQKKSRREHDLASLLEGIDDINWDMDPLETPRNLSVPPPSPQVPSPTPNRPPPPPVIDLDFEVNLSEPGGRVEEPRPRGIPGPAGAVLAGTSTDAYNTRSYLNRDSQRVRPEATQFRDFRTQAWLKALQYCQISEFDPVQYSKRDSTISNIKSSRELNRVPQLVAIIKTCTPNGCGDAFVTLEDPTGTIAGTIHRRLLGETEFGRDIVPGAAILLCKVAVFRPSSRAQYLNITMNNVVQVFRKERE